MIKKFEIFNENKKQKDSLFFNLGDCPASLKVEYKNKEYKILAIADGEKRIYKKGSNISNDIEYYYSSDEELKKDIQEDKIEIENNNWFYILIVSENKKYMTDEIIHSLDDLEYFSDEDVIELIEKSVFKNSILKLTEKELAILEELKCYDSKFECAKNDVGTDFLEDYYSDWDNLKKLFEDWALDEADYYFQYQGLHFICRLEEVEYNDIENKDIINLISKLNIKNAKEFEKVKKNILKGER